MIVFYFVFFLLGLHGFVEAKLDPPENDIVYFIAISWWGFVILYSLLSITLEVKDK